VKLGYLFGWNIELKDVWDGIWGLLYYLWLLVAGIVELVEHAFRMLAGIDPIVGVGEGLSGDLSDVATAKKKDLNILGVLIESGVVRTVFQNLLIVAVALIMFLTIIQIIREQYRQKDGGNPYLIVFRMFRGMITMLFITAVVVVGVQVSG
jgi:hypothetical protein